MSRQLTCAWAILAVAMVVSFVGTAASQEAPLMGYMYPPGGQAGQTVDVVLGGYEWTPDMQVFVHDPRIKLEITGAPGPVIVPEPPYWFGKKSRRGPFKMPRETPAKLTIPADFAPGIVAWQAANANGATAKGHFIVGQFPEIREIEGGLNAELNDAQEIPALPLTINGQVKVTEDIDRYRFKADKSGPVTCLVLGRKLGLDLNAMVEVRDAGGRLIADAADTAGNNLGLTFVVEAGQEYTVSIYDADFRGDRAFVYRMTLAACPRVVAAIPAAGKRGTTQAVEFLGYGLETGAAKLERVSRNVTFPATADATSFDFAVETPHGSAIPFQLQLSDLPETVHPAALAATPGMEVQPLTLPTAITGVLRTQYGEDRYKLTGVKGDLWSFELQAARIGSPLDVSLAMLDAEGKEVARNDDAEGTTDALLDFVVPADGEFTLCVADVSGRSGEPIANYRLIAQKTPVGFTLGVTDFTSIPLGTTGKVALKGTRTGNFTGPITYTLAGLPAGITLPAEMGVAEMKPIAPLDLVVAADAGTAAALMTLVAEAKVGEQTVTRKAGPFVVAITMIPPFTIDAEGLDDVTKWPRGTTFPGPVLIMRKPGFNGEIMLEMTSQQGRVCQGIFGPELVVPPNVNRVLYPIFLPEWLETTRTSRMVTNGVAKIPDPKGNIRYSMSKMITRIGFLPEGALLKLAADTTEVRHVAGEPVAIPVTISRDRKLTESLKLELLPVAGEETAFSAQPLELSADQTQAVLNVTVGEISKPVAERKLTLRATAMKDGQYPVVSETTVVVVFGAATAGR